MLNFISSSDSPKQNHLDTVPLLKNPNCYFVQSLDKIKMEEIQHKLVFRAYEQLQNECSVPCLLQVPQMHFE